MCFEFAMVLMNCDMHMSDIVNVAVVSGVVHVVVDGRSVAVLLTGGTMAPSLGSTASSGISCK